MVRDSLEGLTETNAKEMQRGVNVEFERRVLRARSDALPA